MSSSPGSGVATWQAVLGAVVCVAAVVMVSAGAPADERFGRMLLELLIVGVPVAAGAYALRSPLDRRFGSVLLVMGFAWSLTALAEASASVPYTIGRLTAWLIPPSVWYLLLVFPTGRTSSRIDRALLGAAVAVNVALFYGTAFFVTAFPEHTPWATCASQCPANALLVVDREPAVVQDVLVPLRETLVVVILVGVVLSLLRHWRAAGPLRRRALGGAVAAGTALATLHAAFYVARATDASPEAVDLLGQLWTLSVVAVVVAFIFGLARRRLLVADVFARLGSLVRSGPDPAELRDALAEALGDPTLELLVRDEPSSRWRDGGGREVERTPVPPPGREIALFGADDAGPAVALVHDVALRDDDELLNSMSSMVIAGWRHERVLSTLSRALSEVEESRRRIAETAGLERVRIVRDLHDGAQQRLIALRIRLSMAEDQLREDPAAAAAAVHQLGTEAEKAIEDLRGFAHGVFPPLLNRGLQGALRVIARQAPIRVSVSASGVTRHSIEVDSAVYFVCTEALQNAMKHAQPATGVWITLSEEAGELCFEVRDDGVGFELDGRDHRGLHNMQDRIEAFGGTLHVDSAPGRGTRVIGRVPVTAEVASPAIELPAPMPATPADDVSLPSPPAVSDLAAPPGDPPDQTAKGEGVVVYERLLAALPSAVSDIRRELDGVLEGYGVSGALRADIGLTLSEAATNVILHAYPNGSGGPLYVAAVLEGRALVVSIIDSGAGMHATGDRSAAGLGLVFMNRLADQLTISSSDSAPGTAVHATFDSVTDDVVSPEPAAAGGPGELPHEYARQLEALRGRRP